MAGYKAYCYAELRDPEKYGCLAYKSRGQSQSVNNKTYREVIMLYHFFQDLKKRLLNQLTIPGALLIFGGIMVLLGKLPIGALLAFLLIAAGTFFFFTKD